MRNLCLVKGLGLALPDMFKKKLNFCVMAGFRIEDIGTVQKCLHY